MKELENELVKELIIVMIIIFGIVIVIAISNGTLSRDSYNEAMAYCGERYSTQYCKSHLNK